MLPCLTVCKHLSKLAKASLYSNLDITLVVEPAFYREEVWLSSQVGRLIRCLRHEQLDGRATAKLIRSISVARGADIPVPGPRGSIPEIQMDLLWLLGRMRPRRLSLEVWWRPDWYSMALPNIDASRLRSLTMATLGRTHGPPIISHLDNIFRACCNDLEEFTYLGRDTDFNSSQVQATFPALVRIDIPEICAWHSAAGYIDAMLRTSVRLRHLSMHQCYVDGEVGIQAIPGCQGPGREKWQEKERGFDPAAALASRRLMLETLKLASLESNALSSSSTPALRKLELGIYRIAYLAALPASLGHLSIRSLKCSARDFIHAVGASSFKRALPNLTILTVGGLEAEEFTELEMTCEAIAIKLEAFAR